MIVPAPEIWLLPHIPASRIAQRGPFVKTHYKRGTSCTPRARNKSSSPFSIPRRCAATGCQLKKNSGMCGSTFAFIGLVKIAAYIS